MAIDWSWLEELVAKHAEKALVEFASGHGTETFYGAIVLIEAYDGVSFEILLSTPEHLLAEGCPKFLPGGMKHTIRVHDTIEQWSDIDEAMTEAMEADMDSDTMIGNDYATAVRFRDLACRVAMRLESTFAKLARTPDFAISVTSDPAEPGDMALDRFEKFRSRLSLSAPVGR